MNRLILALATGILSLFPAYVFAADAIEFSPPSDSGVREICVFVYQKPDGKSETQFSPGLRVMELTEGDKEFHLPDDAPANLSNITCLRSPASIAPEKNDYKVVRAGYQLVLIDNEKNRLGLLQLKNGQAAYQAVRGQLTDTERAKLQNVLNIDYGASPTVKSAMSDLKQENTPICQTGHSDALSNGAVRIKPGETICLSVQTAGSDLVPLSVVLNSTESDTIILKFWQVPGTQTMILRVHNPFKQILAYQAAMQRPGKSGYQATSTCAIPASIMGIETWEHPITELTLSNFKIMQDSKSIECK